MKGKKLVFNILALVFGCVAFFAPFVSMLMGAVSVGDRTETNALDFFFDTTGLKNGALCTVLYVLAIVLLVTVACYFVMFILEVAGVKGNWIALVKKIAAIATLVLAIVYTILAFVTIYATMTTFGQMSSFVTPGVGGFLEMLLILSGVFGLLASKK